MIIPASQATALTESNIANTENFLLRQEMYNISREINKAIRKNRFSTQLSYLISAEATTLLTDAEYTVAANDYGTYVSWPAI